VIKRGHKVQSLTGSSILRYYNISPANNTALNATLRFNYSDGELNGLDEAELGLWRSEDGVAWTDIGVNTRDAAQNYAEKNAINSFSIWTLSITSAALPVVFAGVNLKCETNRVVLRWKTLQETNSSHFIVERNTGTGWVNIGKIPAAGFSGAEKNYEFAYGLSSGQGFYRIAQYDLDGQVKYTQVLVADCASPDEFHAWPNPFFQSFTVKMNSSRSSNARLRVVDANGAVVLENKLSLVNGLNQFKVDLSRAVPGTYWLTVEWPEDGKVKSRRLISQ